MLRKVVVYDSGYGGELFADYLEKEIPVLDVIRVIDWRNSDKIINSKKTARKAAMEALKPYINNVDVIIFANYLLSTTSLKFFKKKFKDQKFCGFEFRKPYSLKDMQNVLILTTKAIKSSIPFISFEQNLNAKTKTISCDDWVVPIDDEELSDEKIEKDLSKIGNFEPDYLILGCTQFTDIKESLHKILGHSIKIEDGFKLAFNTVCKTLGLRGYYKKLK